MSLPLGLSFQGKKQKIFCFDHNYSTFPLPTYTHAHARTLTGPWNVLPLATIPSHSIFWTGSSELVTWGDGIRPLTHALTSRGEQPSGGQTSASSARLTQHGWQRQTGKLHSLDDYYKRTNITESNSCLHAKHKKKKEGGGWGWVNAGMLAEQENNLHGCRGKTNLILKVVETEFEP